MIKSKKLENNIKKVYEYCSKNLLSDAQELLDCNLKRSGELFIKALRLNLYNGKKIDTKEIGEKYLELQKLNFNEFEKNFITEFESIEYLQRNIFPYLEKEDDLIKCLLKKLLDQLNDNNVKEVVDLCTEYTFKQLDQLKEAVDYTVLLDGYANFLKEIDYKYIKEVISAENSPSKNSWEMRTLVNVLLQHLFIKTQIESICIEVLSNTRDFKTQDGDVLFADKDNYQFSESIDWVNNQVRQMEYHAMVKGEYGPYDNWSMWASQNFDILIDEPLMKGKYSFRDIMRVFTRAKDFLNNKGFLSRIDINDFQLDSAGLKDSDVKNIIEDNFLSQTWKYYTLEKPFYKYNGNYYCQNMAKRLNNEYILSEVIKNHRSKSVEVAYARNVQKERPDKIVLEKELRKFLSDLEEAELIDWTVDSYPKNGLTVNLDGNIELDALFVWEKTLYIIEAKNIDKKFGVESRYNKIKYLYSGAFQLINNINEICANKEKFIKLLLQKGIPVPEFNDIKGILLCNHLVYSQFKVDSKVCLIGFEDLKRFFKDPLVVAGMEKPILVIKDWWDYREKPKMEDFNTYLSGLKDSYIMEPLLNHRYDRRELCGKEVSVETYVYDENRYGKRQEEWNRIFRQYQNDSKGLFYDVKRKQYIDELWLRRLFINRKWFGDRFKL